MAYRDQGDEYTARAGAMTGDLDAFYGELAALRAIGGGDHPSGRLGSSTAASRAETKASGVYCNGAWDLVDATADATFDLAAVADEALPEGLRGKSLAERRALIDAARTRRVALQAQILGLAARRKEFLDEALARRGDAERSIDTAMNRAVRSQAEALGFRFE